MIEGSTLLNMQELRVLGVAGWHIYILPSYTLLGDSTDAVLQLTELHASAWRHEDHEVLLNAALHGGPIYHPLGKKIVQALFVHHTDTNVDLTLGRCTCIHTFHKNSIRQCPKRLRGFPE